MKATDFLDEPVEKSAEDFLNEGVEKRTGFLPTIARTGGQMLSGAGTSIEDIIGENAVSRVLSETGKGIAEKYSAGINSLSDIAESPWLTVKEAVGQMVPQIGAGVLGRMAGGAAGGALAGPPGALVGGVLGGLAPIFVQEYGGIRDEQKEPGGTEDKIRALAAATGATALEMLGPEGRIINKGLQAPARVAGESLVKSVAKRAGKDVIIEGPTEGLQTGVEKVGASKDPLTPENIEEAAVASVMGGIGGGIVGGAHRAMQGQEPAVTPPQPQLTPREKLLHDTAEAVKRREQAEAKLSEAPPVVPTQETQNDEPLQHAAADEKTGEANAQENADETNETLQVSPNAGPIAPTAGNDIPNTGSPLPNLGTEVGNDNIASVTEQKPVTASLVGDDAALAPKDDISAPAETAPKTVGGIPVSDQSDEQLQAIAQTPETPATTRHAAVAALKSRENAPEVAPTPGTIEPNNVSQTVQNEPIRTTNEAIAPSGSGIAPIVAPTATIRAESNPAAENAAVPVQKSPASTKREQAPALNATAVTKPRQVEKTSEDLQQEVERFQGQYKKGMGKNPANVALKRLAAERPELTWTVEKTTVAEFPDRFDVVGRKPTAQASTQPPKVASPELERRPAPTPAKAPTTAQPAGPAESIPEGEKEAQAPAAQGGFDSEAFDKKRADTIKASRATGAIHLDKVPAGVESMRGREIYYAHDPKERGVIRTVDNRGNVYVNWSDKYSADKEMASESVEDNKHWLKSSKALPYMRVERDGKTYVMQSSLGPSDLKDYVFADSVKSQPANSESAKAPADTDQNINERWKQTARGRDVLDANIETEDAKDDAVVKVMQAAPSYQKLLAAYHSFRRSLYGKDYDPSAIERHPWQLLNASSGVMNAKSARAKTLESLENSVFKETGLPRKKGDTTFRGGKGVDWEKVAPAATEAPAVQQATEPAAEKAPIAAESAASPIAQAVTALQGAVNDLAKTVAPSATNPNTGNRAPQSGMQERAVRADESGSPELAQESAAGGETNVKAIPQNVQEAAINVARKEQDESNTFDLNEEINSVSQNGGADLSALVGDPKYYDEKTEEFTEAGFKEVDRLNEEKARDNLRLLTIDELSDLDHANHRAQYVAMKALLDGMGIDFNEGGGSPTSHYLNVGPLKLRFSNHENLARDVMQRDPEAERLINVAPNQYKFSEALDIVMKDATLSAQPTPAPESAAKRSEATTKPVKVGDEVRIMKVDSVVARTETIGGVRYDLFNGAKMSEERATMRVVDMDSGSVVSIKQYPNFDMAEKEYKDTIAKAKKAEQPAPTPSEKEGGIADKNEGASQFARATEENANIQLQPNEANREYTEKLQAQLRSEGHDFTIAPAALPFDVAEDARGRAGRSRPKNSFTLAERIAGVFGKQVVWMTAEGPFAISGVVGAGSDLSRLVFLDVRSPHPAHVLLGHELAHHMEQDAPGAYRALFQSVSGLLRNHDAYRQLYQIDAATPDADISNEMIGDLMGDHFGNPEFWALVAKQSQNKTAFQLIANTIRKWINKILPMIGMRGLSSELFVTDMKVARSALAQAVIDYAAIQRRPGGINAIVPSRFSRAASTPIFYSALARGLESANIKAAPAAAWRDYIKGLVNKGTVKQDEVEWTGINDWLATQTGKVTKEQVQAFMEQGGVKVTETMLGGARHVREGALGFEVVNADGTVDSRYGREDEARAVAEGTTSPTKFADYQLPGSVPGSYRELVLTLPEPKGTGEYWIEETPSVTGNPMWMIASKRASDGETVYSGRSHGSLRSAEEALREYNGVKSGTFTSSHFSDAGNYLAHTRVNDRILPDGRKVLFVEEIQSDRAQRGRQEGFKDERAFESLLTPEERELRAFNARTWQGAEQALTDAELARAADLQTRVGVSLQEKARRHSGTIPTAPFVAKTDSWTALVLKRLLRYAAEGQYDAIAWTRGDQQVERYTSALRKAVDVIEWKKTPEGVQIVGYKTGDVAGAARIAEAEQQMARMRATGDDNAARYAALAIEIKKLKQPLKVVDTTEKESALSDAIGKSMADKIRNDPNQSGTIEGEGITVSDTGMAGYYDRIVPKVAQEVAKKVGGGKVVEIDIQTGNAPADVVARYPDNEAFQKANTPQKQQALEITPAMREKIMGGLPLFRQGQSTGTTDTITPEMRQRGLALRARITELIGDRPDVKVKTFWATPESPLGSYSQTPFGSVITMALNAKDELSIADHEGYHAAEDLILSDAEREIVGKAMRPGRPLYQRLRQAALTYDRENGTAVAEEIQKPAEARAYGFEFYRRGALKADGVIGRIYQKLQRFFERAQNAIEGLGFKSAQDVFDALDEGRMADTEIRESDLPAMLRQQAFSRAAVQGGVGQGAGEITAPDWVKEQPADMQETLRKAGAWRPKETLQERFAGWTAGWQQKLKQGMVDQFDPIKSLDYHAYMLARMSKSSAGPLESALFDGTVFIDKDGAVDVNYEKGGFIGRMQALKGEHDRFFAWVIGNRSERLMAEGREHNFSKEDIARLKTLNRGKMEDGSSREATYMKALADLGRYNKSIVNMAEKAGLIDPDARQFWEKDFYIPFYRMTEGDATKGPVKSGGLVRQYAFKTLKGGEQAIGDPMENILKNWAHLIDASLKNQAGVASLDAAVKAGVAHETTADEKNAVFVMKNGVKTYYAVDDPFVLDAINSLGFSGFGGPAMKVMTSFKRWLTFGVTISPTFRIRNVIRDSISMIGTNPASYNVLDNVLTGWRLTKEDSPSYASMIAGGGVIRFGTLEQDGATNIKRIVASGVDAGTILDNPAKVKAMLKSAYDWWMHTGDRSENVNRAALYQKLRDEGKSHLEASYAARDTMDFSMMGTWSAIRFLAQTVPFANARLQGLYKLGRGAAEDPRRFAYVVGATALASMALLLAYKDDDDWKQREDFDRESFFWFKIGDKAFRIPKPFEIGAIGTLAERGLEVLITDDLTGKQFAKRMGSVVGQQLSMNPVPQLFMPMIEMWANKDSFTGRAIESMGMEKLSPSERISPYTTAFAQLAGKNGIVSPVQIDHIINGYFGWLGTHAVATADLALRPIMDLPAKPAMRVDDVFAVGDFVRDMPAYQSKYVTRLYEQSKEVQQVMADMRAYQKIGATEKAAEILKEQGDKIRLYRLYTHAEKQLTQINQQIKMAQRRPGDADAKRARLDQLYAQKNRVAKLTEQRAQLTQQ